MQAKFSIARRPGVVGQPLLGKVAVARPARCVRLVPRADNLFVSLLSSAAAGAAVGAVYIFTSPEGKDAELARAQTAAGAIPLAAALGADAVSHAIPGLGALLSLAAEPAGAAAGVAYMMSVLLSSPRVDPSTLAPKGTILAAETAADSRAAVRVPFTQIAATTLKVVDWSNEASSGAGWTTGADGLPKLPINSVLLVLGVGGVAVEVLAHAPVLSLLMPRMLTFAAYLAAAGYYLDKRDA